MIRYRLGCSSGHEFESWFRSSADYDVQAKTGDVACPLCGSTTIEKLPMAPAVVSSRRAASVKPQAEHAETNHNPSELAALRAARKTVIENSEDVGPRFAEEARKIHFGETEERSIRGNSTFEEARALFNDGIPFGVLPRLPEDLD